MSSSKNTFIAFLLNLSFSIIEFIFGWLFGSSAILADAVHDLGDALAIGSSAIMQTYANKPADRVYPFGYKRWNILAALLTSSILIIGSSLILVENIPNLFHPQPVNQDGMLVLGIIAVIINFLASRIVKNGHSHNESILSLHFLEDILGWLAVILVSIILQFTDWYFLDPLLSLCIAIFILSKALPKAWNNVKILLETSPQGVNLEEVKGVLLALENVHEITQLNVWTMDGYEHCATVTVKLTNPAVADKTKAKIRNSLITFGIVQSTIEIL
ncbi:cation (Co/Zn/Cd) efflux protein%2C putative [Streptococcus suis]|uniref:Cation (Co/Zn/Cd) efflux protein, putative n=1 Tax=Streptococcus suis TaxID=1307 RepID=A0A0Z8GV26_STRSU|nr:cation diffusion facilitator family transporter [Streptococcus suis]NQH35969.1 cation transporter [Streptococcus suis]CYV05456.1 cation (Co/Zn/Cd) efflux protein%2C putative [Streptococcus suis]